MNLKQRILLEQNEFSNLDQSYSFNRMKREDLPEKESSEQSAKQLNQKEKK